MSTIRFRIFLISILVIFGYGSVSAQVDTTVKMVVTDTLAKPTDTIPPVLIDTALRIINLTPYITLHVDSSINYKLDINRDSARYFWYLRNAPVGLKINKDDGRLSFKAEKSYFMSGRLKYDQEYKVFLGVQNLGNPQERVDTFITLLFYNTEIILSKLKPGVSANLTMDEGDTLSIPIQCERGSFPIDEIITLVDASIKGYDPVKKCDDIFNWAIPYDFVKETDREKSKTISVMFVGSDKFHNRDTAVIKVTIRDAVNYPFRKNEHARVVKEIERYILQLKFTFKELDKKVRRTKTSRSTFDISSGVAALSGTVLSTSTATSDKNLGKIMPSVGVAIVPVKEAAAPNKTYESNAASQVRASIKRLEYSVSENSLVGERDAEVLTKLAKLRSDLKQVQTQLIDVPMVDTGGLSEEELNEYFNNPKVNRKYKLSAK
ncbi:hypothetical protein ACFSQD_03710 [Flavihumibacter stibioxidans]|uniref:Uncharacterized protein n=1 Tax=Flavihumibacter stibioxidans TaxID=1834163 RepID=A0ABR7M3U3_9BACT|nr:hypothetical protein [Flavihumibacter stibioxidans]MBC6489415.1 hypothetical protein [Flavihumibacter stibioxidans]